MGLISGIQDGLVFNDQLMWYSTWIEWKTKPHDHFNQQIKSIWRNSMPFHNKNP